MLLRNKGNIYCSSKCNGIRNRKSLVCITCGKEFFAGDTKRTKTCSKQCLDKHIKLRSRKGLLGRKPNRNPNVRTRSYKKMIFEQRGYECELCKESTKEILDLHHIIPRKKGGADDSSNLIVLCPNCHRKVHVGIILLEKGNLK